MVAPLLQTSLVLVQRESHWLDNHLVEYSTAPDEWNSELDIAGCKVTVTGGLVTFDPFHPQTSVDLRRKVEVMHAVDLLVSHFGHCMRRRFGIEGEASGQRAKAFRNEPVAVATWYWGCSLRWTISEVMTWW